jgi:hypothetical protein
MDEKSFWSIYWDVAKISQYYNVQINTVWMWKYKNKLPKPFTLVGKSPLWLVSDVVAMRGINNG